MQHLALQSDASQNFEPHYRNPLNTIGPNSNPHSHPTNRHPKTATFTDRTIVQGATDDFTAPSRHRALFRIPSPGETFLIMLTKMLVFCFLKILFNVKFQRERKSDNVYR